MPSNSKNLHPSIHEFKLFVKEHSLLIQEVRSGNKTWQDFYEEWSLLGADHPDWEKYKRKSKNTTQSNTEDKTVQNAKVKDDTDKAAEEASSSTDMTTNILGMLKNINFNDLQHHMAQVSSVISNVQGLMQSFQGKNQPNQPQRPDDPFSFRRH
ncbi:YlbD family protein [Alkalihalobacillus sp. BA299]|uniref:YlbD family protein n=1 Tax=Alkalihalobacillus sp. BA299 TaxID=2815938 RepID=UPI001ADCC402|nr:YlbD family protein [Alkalihalobacillus sp. BA299]